MATRRTNWKGVFPACVTPFKADGALDETATRRMIDMFIAEGVSGLIIAGSTGEWFSLTDEERVRLFAIAKEHTAGRVPVIGGTSAIGTREAVALTKAAKDLGLDGVMVLPPPYALPTRREVVAHFAEIGKVGIPIMIYNNPPRTSINIDAGYARELAKIDTVVALKDSIRDLYQMSETIYALSDTLAMFVGLEPYIMANVHRGAVGTVSMMGNVCMPDMVDYFNLCAAGKWEEAKASQKVVDRLYHLLQAVGAANYVFVKEAMAILGRAGGGGSRRPYLPIDDAQKKALEAGLREIPLKQGGKRLAAE
ncbi:MAG: dihydrodipicolinate synthase family protein [Alphaproteobacteria bacterium]